MSNNFINGGNVGLSKNTADGLLNLLQMSLLGTNGGVNVSNAGPTSVPNIANLNNGIAANTNNLLAAQPKFSKAGLRIIDPSDGSIIMDTDGRLLNVNNGIATNADGRLISSIGGGMGNIAAQSPQQVQQQQQQQNINVFGHNSFGKTPDALQSPQQPQPIVKTGRPIVNVNILLLFGFYARTKI